jgi:hypothetical protein
LTTTNKRLTGPALLTNVAATKYTVPASTVTVVQHIHVENPTASAVPFTLSIGVDAAGTRIYDAYSIGAGQVLDTFAKYVLNAGEVLQAFAGTTNVMTLTIDGQELTPG